MKIAITADLHLTSRENHPERYAALENILTQLIEKNIDTLIIAGDLFDAQFNQFRDFETLCSSGENKKIQLLITPGNHDAHLQSSMIALDHVRVFAQPEWVALEKDSARFLFVPYREGRSMGDLIAAEASPEDPYGWVLVGHGDWIGNARSPNLYERGVYMPLSQRDLNLYRPKTVFLGHIHAPYARPPIFYPGSPCGMDITETGRRRFLIYDTVNNNVESNFVDTQHIFFNRTFTIFPVEDEALAMQRMLTAWIEGWGIEENENHKVRVRVNVKGYATDKRLLKSVIQNTLSAFDFYDEPDLSEISTVTDPSRDQIIEIVYQQIEQLALNEDLDGPNKEQILLEALQLVYGA